MTRSDPAAGGVTAERRERPVRRASALIAALVVFFVVPVRSGHSAGVLALEIAISLAGVALVGWIVLGELLREWRGGSPTILRGRHLLLLFEVVLLGFALTYYALSVYSDGEMTGLRTRVDALYFTATTMTTVGYGDIHPIGQVARVIATVHMGFNVLFVAAVVRLLDVRVRRASGASQDAGRRVGSDPGSSTGLPQTPPE